MSRHSKARRAARRKNAPVVSARRRRPAATPHAQLSVDGAVVATLVGDGAAWRLALDGRALPPIDSAAMAMAVLKRIAEVRDADGADVRLAYSTALRAAATAEADALELTLQEHLARLDAERSARADGAAASTTAQVPDAQADPREEAARGADPDPATPSAASRSDG